MRVWWCAVRTGIPEAGEAHDALAWVDKVSINDLAWLDPDLPSSTRSPAAVDRLARLSR